MAIILAT